MIWLLFQPKHHAMARNAANLTLAEYINAVCVPRENEDVLPRSYVPLHHRS